MKKLLFPLLLLVLSGCASLPVIECQDLNDPNSRSKSMYDVDNAIVYKVQQDGEFLYLELLTDDQTSIQTITQNGLYVYIDSRGGKSKRVYFNYPVQKKGGRGPMGGGMMPMGGTGGNMMQSGQEMQMPNPEDMKINITEIIEELDVEAVFSDNDVAEMIPVYAKSNDFKVELSATEDDQLLYKLRLPIDLILDERVEDQEISIGIETGEMEVSGGGQGGPGGGPGGGGGPQGGGMGGMSGGGPQGGGPGGEGPSDMSGMDEQISIWFKIVL